MKGTFKMVLLYVAALAGSIGSAIALDKGNAQMINNYFRKPDNE